MANDINVVIHQGEVNQLVHLLQLIPALRSAATPILSRARRAAPVSRRGNHGRAAGFLRANIVLRNGQDAGGRFVDVASTARTPGGFPYGALQERRRPYLRPSIR